ncbi:MAG: hypothetical protein LUE31_12180 [Lachnospiraceae bacterium]|nr:hypothetical protein [Lachnospiraceae bacterium]
MTLRNMQLFVKDGQLFALNAPDDIVPGSILIDTYQGNTYMTVLRDDGQLVDLMDEINYPDDFVNRNIKNISSNLYSDLTYVQVEYEDGAIVIFNYLTGSVIFEQEGEESEGTDVLGDFWSFLTGFFQDKLDTAYAEVTNAYQNAVTMKDFLSTQLWRDWFASEETSDEYVDGDAEDSTMSLASDSEEEETGGEYVDGDADESTVLGVSDVESADGTGSSGSDGTEATIIGSIPVYEGEDVTASDSEESEDAAADESGATGSAADGEGDAQDGVSAVSESGTTGSATESADSADAETSEAQEESADETVAAYVGESAQEAAEETAASEGGASIEDALIIAYDSNANGYAVYSTSDLLSKSDETLVSVDEQLEHYLSSGGEVTGSEGKILSLEVTSSQQNGLVILALIGAAVGLILVVLLVQRTARRRRRSSR